MKDDYFYYFYYIEIIFTYYLPMYFYCQMLIVYPYMI